MNPNAKSHVPTVSEVEKLDDDELDSMLIQMDRHDMLKLSPAMRMRWFYLLQVQHSELLRVICDLAEILEPRNEVKIVSMIGMTGIGKTTLATTILARMVGDQFAARKMHEVPVLYIKAPANGERSMSWKVLYRRIKVAAGDQHIDLQRSVEVTEGELKASRGGKQGLAELREELELLLKNRNVRVLIIDEALHLLRFNENAAIMDTLKSLADIHETKLVLIGTYQISPLMIEYGQLARRSAILHYRRYSQPAKHDPNKLTNAEEDFKKVVRRLQDHWPCEDVPNLEAIWQTLMRLSLGSVGMLKSLLLQLASLQMRRMGEAFHPRDLIKAARPPKVLRVIEAETVAGEEQLEGACYGDADLGSATDLKDILERVQEKVHA